jgi:hypothetical protein
VIPVQMIILALHIVIVLKLQGAMNLFICCLLNLHFIKLALIIKVFAKLFVNPTPV